MIHVTLTPQHAGMVVQGDYQDFYHLYEAIYEVLGGEEDHPAFSSARMRILGFCYDLRHAFMGDRELSLLENNMTGEKMRCQGKLVPSTNVYYAFAVLMPDMLFLLMALNDFCLLKARREVKAALSPFQNRKLIWDKSLAQVRMLQAAVFDCLSSTLEPKAVSRLLNLLVRDYTWTEGYITQYIDELNVELLKLEKEKRLKQITIIAKRLSELDAPKYLGMRREIREFARINNITPDEVHVELDYPEVEW